MEVRVNSAKIQIGAADILLLNTGVDGNVGLSRTDTTANTITLYRGESDPYWNYVRVQIWIIK